MEKLREAEQNLQQLELKVNTKANSSEGDIPKPLDDKAHNEEVQQLRLQLEVS